MQRLLARAWLGTLIAACGLAIPGGRLLDASIAASLQSAGRPSIPSSRQKGPPPQSPAPADPALRNPAPGEPWPTWGGPGRNFTVNAIGLARAWPADGPPRVWSRRLGDGYSAIAAEAGVLYTAFRRGNDDVVTALDAASGATRWEAASSAPFRNAYAEAVGPGPYAMPQVVGDRIVMASGNGRLASLDKRTGRTVWAHDLYGEYNGTRLEYGYSSHALPYKDTLIVLVGGRGGLLTWLTGSGASAVVAFRQSDGSVVWQSLTFDSAHSSPVLISVDGQPQVVALLAQEIVGFSPDDGRLLWRHAHPTEHGLAISTPVWGRDNVLVVSSAYGGGTRALELRQSGGTTRVRELWHTPRIQSHFGSIVRIDDHVFLSSGHSGPAFMTAIEVKSGTIAWQRRGFAKAHLVHADGKVVILDEDGALGLAVVSPQGLEVLSQVALLTRLAWTPPTLVGTRLYVRDRATIMALDLGVPPAPRPGARAPRGR